MSVRSSSIPPRPGAFFHACFFFLIGCSFFGCLATVPKRRVAVPPECVYTEQDLKFVSQCRRRLSHPPLFFTNTRISPVLSTPPPPPAFSASLSGLFATVALRLICQSNLLCFSAKNLWLQCWLFPFYKDLVLLFMGTFIAIPSFHPGRSLSHRSGLDDPQVLPIRAYF